MKTFIKLKVLTFFLFAFLLFATVTTNAQIGIGIANPAPSAQLDVSSTTKGFLPPRMTYQQRLAIASPDTGLIIWCKNCGTSGELQVFNGTRWTNLAGEPISPFQIGDKVNGGYVFLVSDNGQHGYIVAFQSLGPTLWEDAEKLCTDSRGEGYSDWLFPAYSQVKEIFKFDKILFPGFLGLDIIWSGIDETHRISFWVVPNYPPGHLYGGGVGDARLVRPIRTF